MNTAINNLTLRLLPAPLIIKYFQNDPKCNYERYLVELLNKTQWRQRFSKDFQYCEQQAHGECDAGTDTYELDFKLCASESRLKAQSVFSPEICFLSNGTVGYKVKTNPHQPITASRLHVALRGLSLNHLQSIRQNTSYSKQTIEYDIYRYLTTLETKKNILLFFPYTFHFKTAMYQGHEDQTIIEAINQVFSESFAYRSMVAPGFDTFFVTLHHYNFLFSAVEKDQAVFLESIPALECDTFMYLLKYAIGGI